DLIAYYTPASPSTDGGTALSARLRSALAEVLPGYMIPAAFHAMERLPVTAGGKLDRRAVPQPTITARRADADDRPLPQGMAQLCGGSVDFAAEVDRRVPATGHAAPAPALRSPGDVLLTGATGFCGAHMIDELLRRTTGRILCLVRASDEQQGMERIRASHRRYVRSDLSSARV